MTRRHNTDFRCFYPPDIFLEVSLGAPVEHKRQMISAEEYMATTDYMRVADEHVGLQLPMHVFVDVAATAKILDGDVLSCVPAGDMHTRCLQQR